MIRFNDHYARTGACDLIYVRLDQDDPRLDEYRAIDNWPVHCFVEVGPRARMPQALNEAFHSFPREICYGILGDDVVPRSPEWDFDLQKAAGSWGIAYGRDGQNDERHGTHPLMGGQLARAWGRLAIDGLVHLYNDTVWMALGKAIGNLVFRSSVYMEHLHFSTGKSEFDEIYDRTDAEGSYADRDRQVFEQWRDNELPALATRIRAMIG